MFTSPQSAYTTFEGFRRIAAGSLEANALAVRTAREGGAAGPILIFDDATGRTLDVDTRGSEAEMLARLAATFPAVSLGAAAAAGSPAEEAAEGPQGRGRPKLGVVPREVTLLPRHWDWLAAQPGGASVALRKLVEAARRDGAERDQARKAQERAYHFMVAIAGDLPRYEEATRALFAGDRERFHEQIAEWPEDVREHAAKLAFGQEGPADA